jgi:sodium-dependent dicarboxylate transporter 2/3/5
MPVSDRGNPLPETRSGPGAGQDEPGGLAVARPGAGLPAHAGHVTLPRRARRVDWRRVGFIMLGIGLFLACVLSPAWPDAVDPEGSRFALGTQGKAALGLFLLAGVWWVFEVIPIGVTGITIGVIQVMFLIRGGGPRIVGGATGQPELLGGAFTDFFDPSVWFIFGSIVIGMVFSKTGLTQRIAYRMLASISERTSMIYLGAFVMTAALTLIMAHTAVAAAVFPLLMTIHALYDDSGRPTRFGKGLFIGMAYTAGAGSIITLLGAARGAVAIGFFKEIIGREIGFFELTYYMLPVGAVMILLLWAYMYLLYRPERKVIPGLKARARKLSRELGPLRPAEIATLVIVLSAIVILCLKSLLPAQLGWVDKSAVILSTTLLFFLFRILTVKDLEMVPWNIILLFGGAMSIGFCLWQTGAAEWLAINWLSALQAAPWLLFVLGITFFVLIMTNFIMNVAAIAISMPVALTMAPYLGVAPEVVMFACLVAAGMPFLLLVGAAPNAIAYESRQFRPADFFLAGIPASLMLLVVTALFVWKIWPLMGMPVRVAAGG